MGKAEYVTDTTLISFCTSINKITLQSLLLLKDNITVLTLHENDNCGIQNYISKVKSMDITMNAVPIYYSGIL